MYKIAIFLFFFVASVCAQTVWDLTSSGRKAYDRGDYEEALAMFESAHRRSPDDENIIYNIAITLGKLGRYGDAESYLKTLSPNNPNLHAEVLRGRGLMLEAQADQLFDIYRSAAAGQEIPEEVRVPSLRSIRSAYDRAIAEYVKALELYPENRDILANAQGAAIKRATIPEDDDSENDDSGCDDSKCDDSESDDSESDDSESDDSESDDSESDDSESDDSESDDSESDDSESDDSESDDSESDDSESDDSDSDDSDSDDSDSDDSESDEDIDLQEAMRMIEQFSDDSPELHRPVIDTDGVERPRKEW